MPKEVLTDKNKYLKTHTSILKMMYSSFRSESKMNQYYQYEVEIYIATLLDIF